MRKINYLFILFVCCNNHLMPQDEPIQKQSVLKEVSEGDTEAIKKRLENGESCSEKDAKGNIALHIAVGKRRLDIVKLLLEKSDIDVNAQNNEGDACLMLAAQYYYYYPKDDVVPEIFTMLLNHNADTSVTTKYGDTILHLAATARNYKMTQLILEKNPSLVCAYDRSDVPKQPLHCAIGKSLSGVSPASRRRFEEDSLETVKLLIKHGAPLTTLVCGNCEDTLLHYAAKRRRIDIIFELLRNNAPIQRNRKNLFFYHYLLKKGGAKEIDQLIWEKVDMTGLLENGNNVLHYALELKGNQENYETTKQYYENPRHRQKLARKRYACALKLMLAQFINQKNNNGETPIFIAIKNGDNHMVEKLIQSGADLSIMNNNGYLPIHEAVAHDGCAFEKLWWTDWNTNSFDDSISRHRVSEYGSLVKLTRDGNTVLHVAAQSGRRGAMGHLLRGFDVASNESLNAINDNNETPFMIAARHGQLTMMRYFIRKQREYYSINKSGFVQDDTYFINGQVQLMLNELKDNCLENQQAVYVYLNEEHMERIASCQKVVDEYVAAVNLVNENKILVNQILEINPLYFSTHPAYKPIEPIYKSLDQIYSLTKKDRKEMREYYEECKEKELRAKKYLQEQYQCLCKKQ